SFHKKGMDAGVIGEVIEENQLILQFKGTREILFDFDKESITGI
ncbi:MAG: methanogenesis marker 2 protein, partial [Deltaproteobacteria bacterium]|nr:methanogenesis marker 2 protein [Deltaproteobacteria bacterium]